VTNQGGTEPPQDSLSTRIFRPLFRVALRICQAQGVFRTCRELPGAVRSEGPKKPNIGRRCSVRFGPGRARLLPAAGARARIRPLISGFIVGLGESRAGCAVQSPNGRSARVRCARYGAGQRAGCSGPCPARGLRGAVPGLLGAGRSGCGAWRVAPRIRLRGATSQNWPCGEMGGHGVHAVRAADVAGPVVGGLAGVPGVPAGRAGSVRSSGAAAAGSGPAARPGPDVPAVRGTVPAGAAAGAGVLLALVRGTAAGGGAGSPVGRTRRVTARTRATGSCVCSNRPVEVRRPAWWKYPEACHHGHPWGPGRVIVGWEPCDCGAAQAQPGHGHLWVRCWAEGCRPIWRQPPHRLEKE
jgi:hypothetical protein